MPDYQLGKIYKIVCNITGEYYIGSTTEPTLARRLAKHVKDFKLWKQGKAYVSKFSSFSIIERNDYSIYLIECFPCDSREELRANEGKHQRIKLTDKMCLNVKIEKRTTQEYRHDNKEKKAITDKEYASKNKDKLKIYNNTYNEQNKEHISESKKKYRSENIDKNREWQLQYRKDNADKIKQTKSIKCLCDCGSNYCYDGKARHIRSLKHQAYIKQINDV